MSNRAARKTLCPRGMIRMLIPCVALLLFAPLPLLSARGQSEQGQVSALPDAEGKQLVVSACSTCHGLRETLLIRDGEKGWEDTVNRMVLYGAQLSPAEADRLVHYLATQLGPGSPLPVSSSSNAKPGAVTRPRSSRAGESDRLVHTEPLPFSESSNALNPETLPEGPGKDLVASRCVLCHSLGKAVGVARTKSDWVSVTNNMVHRGMKATPGEIQTVIVYLQTNFGRSDSDSTQTPPAASSK